MEPPTLYDHWQCLTEAARMLFALFADADSSNVTVMAFSFGGAAVSALFACLTAYIRRLAVRDKLQHDAGLVALTERMKACEERREAQESEIEVLKRLTGFYDRPRPYDAPPQD